jgi:hypothetical protein
MCLDCGCHRPDDDHGDPRHLTLQDIRRAAQASGISPQEAVDRIVAAVQAEEQRAEKRRMADAALSHG